MKKNFNILIVSLLVLSTLLVFTPQVASAVNPVIKIGALGPLGIPVGVEMDNGAKLAVKEINAAGGITITSGTYDFELFTETTSGIDGLPNPTVAATNLQKLIISDGVSAILGGFRTAVVLGAIQPTINTTLTPFLGVGSTTAIITEYYYRVGPQNATTLARNLIALYGLYLRSNSVKNVSKVVVVREDSALTSAFSASVAGALTAVFGMSVDVTMIAPIPESASSSDVASALNPLLSATDVDAILTLFSGPVGKVVTEQWSALGLNDKMYLAGINDAAQDSEYFVNTGGAAAGEIIMENVPPGENPTPTAQAFRDAYQTEYNEAPTYTSFAAYDAVYIIKDAIVRADGFTSADIHSMLPSTDYNGVAARYKFTSESTAGQVASPAIPEAFMIYNHSIAHDLFTPSTIGVSGFPYSQLYSTQWNENGTKEAIWASTPLGYAPTLAPPYAIVTPPPQDTQEIHVNVDTINIMSSKVNESVRFDFTIESTFEHDMPNVTLLLNGTLNGVEMILYETSFFLGNNSTYTSFFNVIFTQVGVYNLSAILFDDVGDPWSFFLTWEVLSADIPSDTTSDPPVTTTTDSSTLTNDTSPETPNLDLPGFTIIYSMLSVGAVLLVIQKKRK